MGNWNADAIEWMMHDIEPAWHKFQNDVDACKTTTVSAIAALDGKEISLSGPSLAREPHYSSLVADAAPGAAASRATQGRLAHFNRTLASNTLRLEDGIDKVWASFIKDLG